MWSLTISGSSSANVSRKHGESWSLYFRGIWKSHSWRRKIRVITFSDTDFCIQKNSFVLSLRTGHFCVISRSTWLKSYFYIITNVWLYFRPIVQFKLLHSMFHLCSNQTKYILLSTYIKLINLFPEIKGDIEEVCTVLTHCNCQLVDFTFTSFLD